MRVLCEFRDLQESHIWHFQKFECPLVPDSQGVKIIGDETSWTQEYHKSEKPFCRIYNDPISEEIRR